MAPISRDDLEAAHRGMVTALENVLFDLGEVGRARVKQLADTSQEIFTDLQDRLGESESSPLEGCPGCGRLHGHNAGCPFMGVNNTLAAEIIEALRARPAGES